MRRSLLAVALLLALVAGCGIPTDGEPRPLADEANVTVDQTTVAPGDTITGEITGTNIVSEGAGYRPVVLPLGAAVLCLIHFAADRRGQPRR